MLEWSTSNGWVQENNFVGKQRLVEKNDSLMNAEFFCEEPIIYIDALWTLGDPHSTFSLPANHSKLDVFDSAHYNHGASGLVWKMNIAFTFFFYYMTGTWKRTCIILRMSFPEHTFTFVTLFQESICPNTHDPAPCARLLRRDWRIK